MSALDAVRKLVQERDAYLIALHEISLGLSTVDYEAGPARRNELAIARLVGIARDAIGGK